MPKEEEIKELKEVIEHVMNELAKIHGALELVTLGKATFNKGTIVDEFGALAESMTALQQRVKTMDAGAPPYLKCLERLVGGRVDARRVHDVIERFTQALASTAHRDEAIEFALCDSFIPLLWDAAGDFRTKWQIVQPLCQALQVSLLPVQVNNTRFNPDIHEMVGTAARNLPPGTIVELVRNGIIYKGRVILNAQVLVQQ